MKGLIIIVFPILGIFLLLSKKVTLDNFKKEYVILAVTSTIIIGIYIVLPSLLSSYNLTRIFMQSAIITSLATVIGGVYFAKLFKSTKLFYFFIIVFFLYSSSFITQLLGIRSTLILNEGGFDFDSTYVYDSEISSAKWLRQKYNNNYPLYTDPIADLRVKAYGNINNTYHDIYPNTIYKNSYIYLSSKNTLNKVTYSFYDNTTLAYEFPYEFVSNNANKIYSSGGSEIFK